MNWDDFRHFLAVHKQGNLARAARLLRINATTVARRLCALEEQVGARLFNRTPEGYVLTLAGHEFLPFAQRMEAEAHGLERAVRGADQRLAGSVRLSTTEMLGTRFIAPHLAAFAALHPEITVELACTNIPVHLGRREADIALRLAQPREDNVVVKRIALIHLSLYASRDYIAQRGAPSRPDRSLTGHDFVSFARSRAFSIENDWLDKRVQGARTVLRSDSVSAIFSATVAGLGIALLPDVVAAAEPALVRIATRDSPAPRVVWQAVHKDLARAPRIRALLNYLSSGALGGLAGAASQSRRR